MKSQIENIQGQKIAKISAVAYVILCSLFLFTIKCKKSEEISSIGVIVNLGTVETGMNESNVPAAENIKEVEESSTSNEIESTTQELIETNVTAAKNPTQTTSSTNTSNTPKSTTSESESDSRPTVNENALFSGNNNSSQDNKNPTESLESDIYGDITGSVLGSSGKGWGLNGRGLVSKPQPTNPTNEFGNVTVKITVDKYGKVIKAEFTSFNSTTTNLALVNIAVSEAYKVKFNNVASDSKARDKQVGYVVFKFKAS